MQIKSDFWYLVEWAKSTLFGLLHQKPYSEKWDRVLNELLDKYGEDAKWSRHTVLLGKAEVWVANRMCAYGCLYRTGRGVISCRPSVSTMIRLAKLQDQAGVIGKEEEGEYWDKFMVNVYQNERTYTSSNSSHLWTTRP